MNQNSEKIAKQLVQACADGNETEISEAVNMGANINTAVNPDSKNDIALTAAARAGNLDIVRILIERYGAEVNQIKQGGATALSIASQEGKINVVRFLIQKNADVTKSDCDDCTPLYVAAQNGHEACVKALCEAGANINKARDGGATPLFTAARKGHTTCVQALIEAGADLHKARDNNVSPLYIAAQNGHAACVQALIGAGANVDSPTHYNYTPLFIAAVDGQQEIIRELCQAGANLNAAIQLAKDKKSTVAVRVLEEELARGNTGSTSDEDSPTFMGTKNSLKSDHSKNQFVVKKQKTRQTPAPLYNPASVEIERLRKGEADSKVREEMLLKKQAELKAQVMHYQKEVEIKNEKELCCICFEVAKTVVFLPCKHYCACERCAFSELVQQCPLCRCDITEKLTMYT